MPQMQERPSVGLSRLSSIGSRCGAPITQASALVCSASRLAPSAPCVTALRADVANHDGFRRLSAVLSDGTNGIATGTINSWHVIGGGQDTSLTAIGEPTTASEPVRPSEGQRQADAQYRKPRSYMGERVNRQYSGEARRRHSEIGRGLDVNLP